MSNVTSASLAAVLCVCAGASGAEPSVARGEYLVRGPMGCGNCHTPIGADGPVAGEELAGRLVEENPLFTAYASNITPGGDVAGWSDAEVARAIREGLRPDGRLLGPFMPFEFYRHISDDDLASIVAFLRTVPAVEKASQPSIWNFPLPPAYGPTLENVAAPASGVTAEWGEYVAQTAHCMGCHTPRGPDGRLIEARFGAGGQEFPGPWGVSVSPNLTPSEDGIAGYSDDELKAMITTGVDADGAPMLPPMPYPYLARMTPEDLDALVLYIRTLPPLPDAN